MRGSYDEQDNPQNRLVKGGNRGERRVRDRKLWEREKRQGRYEPSTSLTAMGRGRDKKTTRPGNYKRLSGQQPVGPCDAFISPNLDKMHHAPQNQITVTSRKR